MQQQPNETLLEYYRRLAAMRQGGLLGTKGMMDTPAVPSVQEAAITSAPLGQVIVQEQGDDGGGAPYTPGMTKQQILERQIGMLGGQEGSYGDMAGGFMGPLGGLLGYGADMFEKDAAALELGRQLGETDVEAAKKKGYGMLTEDNFANLVNQAQAEDFGAVTDRSNLNRYAQSTYENPFTSSQSSIGSMFDGMLNLGKSVGSMFGIGEGVQEYGNNSFSRGMADNYTGPVLAATPGSDFDPTTFSSSYGDTSYENNGSGATSGGNWSSANDSFSGGRDSDGWGE